MLWKYARPHHAGNFSGVAARDFYSREISSVSAAYPT
jgi:hypothetical protein